MARRKAIFQMLSLAPIGYSFLSFLTKNKKSVMKAETVYPQWLAPSELGQMNEQFVDVDGFAELLKEFENNGKIVTHEHKFDGLRSVWVVIFKNSESREEWINRSASLFNLREMVRLNVKSRFYRLDSLVS